MLKNLAEALEAFRKLTPVPLLALAMASAVVLFLPEGIAGTLGMAEFRESYQFWIGLIFICSWCYLLAHFLWWSGARAVQDYQRRRVQRQRQQSLAELTLEEIQYLSPYVRDGKNTQYFDCTDGVAGGLAAKRILFRSSNLMTLDAVPYNLQPWARNYLNQHPELLGLDKG